MPSSNNYEQIALDTFNTDKPQWQDAFVQASSDRASNESKKKRFREQFKKLLRTNRITENDDGSLTKLDS